VDAWHAHWHCRLSRLWGDVGYHGVAKIRYGKPGYTQWAPDIVYDHGQYHMFLVIVPGTFKDWNAPRYIVHLVSRNLEKWTYVSKLDTGSDRIIDPSLFHAPDGTWRMWYKDELDKSHIYYAESTDLTEWKPKGPAITDRASEGPKVFRWKNQYWMITDAWKGLGVYHSNDLTHWIVQADNILEAPGHIATDRTKGDHCDVVVSGERAFIFYFTRQGGVDLDKSLSYSERHTVLQVAELHESDGALTVDRDATAHVYLRPPQEVASKRLKLRFRRPS
jgi:Glycosyl hydrolases family 43